MSLKNIFQKHSYFEEDGADYEYDKLLDWKEIQEQQAYEDWIIDSQIKAKKEEEYR